MARVEFGSYDDTMTFSNVSFVMDREDVDERSVKRRSRTRRQPGNGREVITAITKDRKLNMGIEMLKERKGEIGDPMAMTLAGIAMHGPARMYMDNALDRIWANTPIPRKAEEVIVGAGFHAAVYCAVRVAMGFPKPVVLEKRDRAGGAFAVSRGPSFYLNSRNRPGMLGIPGRGEALNVLPMGPIQPSMLSGDEYQRNSDLAFAIRASLAMNAKVITGVNVTQRGRYGAALEFKKNGLNRSIDADRLIWATGIGEEKPPIKNDRVMTFSQFMAKMDEPFPLRGLKKVAVVGAGDSGKTAVEALVGQGPSSGMSTAELDYIERIDWYGVPEACNTATRWKEGNRSRYAGIARELIRRTGDAARIRVFTSQAEQVYPGFDSVRVNGRAYDCVIWCGGFVDEGFAETRRSVGAGVWETVDGRKVGRRTRVSRGEVLEIGPAAGVSMDTYETQALPASVPENAVALFRYADMTATLAASLKKPGSIRKYNRFS